MNKRQLNEVYNEAKLTESEVEMMVLCLSGDADFYGTTAYEKLYEYFAFETNEMPYEVAKARTADPDTWILDKLSGENQEGSSFLDKLKHIGIGENVRKG
tara:strand:+ start:253 stop:552 length:300 start_codon:yes stop_codon:yes gene_type:complete